MLQETLVAFPSSCHPPRPLYAKGLCRSCYEKQLRHTNPEFAERQRINCRKWVEEHKAYKRALDKQYRKLKGTSEYNHFRKCKLYGLTPQDYDTLLQKQDGCCAICRRPPGKTRLAIDHCHKTGQIRGLLCFRCNWGMSYFKESANILSRAAQYLKGEEAK